jgi:hypothetical protein
MGDIFFTVYFSYWPLCLVMIFNSSYKLNAAMQTQSSATHFFQGF